MDRLILAWENRDSKAVEQLLEPNARAALSSEAWLDSESGGAAIGYRLETGGRWWVVRPNCRRSRQRLPPHRRHPPSLEGLRARYAARLVAHVERVPPEVLQAVYAADTLPGYAQSTTTMLQQTADEGTPLTYTLRPQLKNLKPETLFIWGDQDKLGPAVLGSEMASMIPTPRTL